MVGEIQVTVVRGGLVFSACVVDLQIGFGKGPDFESRSLKSALPCYVFLALFLIQIGAPTNPKASRI